MRGVGTLGMVGLLVAVGCGDSPAPTTVVDLSGPWTRATPAEAGIDAATLPSSRGATAASSSTSCRVSISWSWPRRRGRRWPREPNPRRWPTAPGPSSSTASFQRST